MVLLPGLVYLVGQRSVRAAGTSLLLVWLTSAAAVGLHARDGNVSGYLFLPMIAGSIPGAYLGTKVGLKIAGPKLRLYFVFVVAAALVLIGWELLRMTLG